MQQKIKHINANEKVGINRLTPGQRHTKEEYEKRRIQRENELVQIAIRIPRKLAIDIDSVLSEINEDCRVISKQNYLTAIIAKAIKEDKEELKNIGEISRYSREDLFCLR